MITIKSFWKIGQVLKHVEYTKKEVARYNKKMSVIEVELKTDFEVEGWIVEGHLLPPAIKITREFVRLPKIVIGNKISFLLEDSITKQIGEWQLELVLKGPNGEIYYRKDKLKYIVVETAVGMSLNEILNEEDSQTVEVASSGLDSAITAAGTKEEEIVKTGNDKVEEIGTTEGSDIWLLVQTSSLITKQVFFISL